MRLSRCATCGYPSDGAACEHCRGTIRGWRDGRALQPGRRAAVVELVEGFVSLPLGALRLLLDQAFMGRLKAPILAGTLAFGAVFVPLFLGGAAVAGWWLGAHPATPWFADVRALTIALLVVWQIGPTVAEAMIAPFLDGLAAATESAHGVMPGSKGPPGAWSGLVQGARDSARVLCIGLLLLPATTALAATGFGAPLASLASAWLCAFALFDLPCARRRYDLRERFLLVRRNWARALGFGLAFQVGTLIFVFDLFLLIPAATVAVHALYLRCDKTAMLASRRTGATVDAP